MRDLFLFLFPFVAFRINIILNVAYLLIIPIFIESKNATAGTVQTKRNDIAAVSDHIRRIKCPHSSQFHVF